MDELPTSTAATFNRTYNDHQVHLSLIQSLKSQQYQNSFNENSKHQSKCKQ